MQHTNKILHLVMALALLLYIGSASAQSLGPQVLASASATSTGGSMSWTAGEMTMVKTFASGSLTLTQGFHQPRQMTTAINELAGNGVALSLYPNPASTAFNLRFDVKEEATVEVFNQLGQLMMPPVVIADSGTQSISSELLAAGLYHVRVRTANTQTVLPLIIQ